MYIRSDKCMQKPEEPRSMPGFFTETGEHAVAVVDCRSEDLVKAVKDCKAAGESGAGLLAILLGSTNHDTRFDVGDYLQMRSTIQGVIAYSAGPLDHERFPAVRDRWRDSLHRSLIPSRYKRSDRSRWLAPLELGAILASSLEVMDDSRAPPFFLAHGTSDVDMPLCESRRFAQVLMKSRVPVVWKPIAGVGHLFQYGKFSELDLQKATYRFVRNVSDGKIPVGSLDLEGGAGYDYPRGVCRCLHCRDITTATPERSPPRGRRRVLGIAATIGLRTMMTVR
ncbi:hypothetical protein H2200_006496 [Cladophialophora chaetospira]|uniref:Peptidase S9 prolyl oligopeptidase catalytic domain-containing protein n=1 Tax=Cladophialophora chaetospira TaxID=386627 RepID=A0AA38X8G1_9EURO|nr:hypothetical protein H2200_006496 [Cladophialophora chaetospira]